MNIRVNVRNRHLTVFIFLLVAVTSINLTFAQSGINPGHDASSIRGGGFTDGDYYFENNLDVGTSSSSGNLHVYGDMVVEEAIAEIELRDIGDDDWKFVTLGDDLAIQSDQGFGFENRMVIGPDLLHMHESGGDGGLQIDSEDGIDDISLYSYGDNKADLDFFRAKGTIASPEEIEGHSEPYDTVGTIRFYAWCPQNNGFSSGAQIRAVGDGSMCSVLDDAPMALEFLTKPNVGSGAAGALTRRMVIDTYGRVIIGDPAVRLLETQPPPGSLVVDNGALCIDDGGTDCDDAIRNEGTIYAESSSITTIDLAENYPTKDSLLEAGDLVSLDLENPVFVQRSLKELPLIGVVSTEPGVLLGGFANKEFEGEREVPVALSGRVPAKVSLEGGQISVGDRIGASSVYGIGMRVTDGQSAGIALEPLDQDGIGDEGHGTIMIFVNLDY